jgi:hypothetical protein
MMAYYLLMFLSSNDLEVLLCIAACRARYRESVASYLMTLALFTDTKVIELCVEPLGETICCSEFSCNFTIRIPTYTYLSYV